MNINEYHQKCVRMITDEFNKRIKEGEKRLQAIEDAEEEELDRMMQEDDSAGYI